jgi:hypothetical protein
MTTDESAWRRLLFEEFAAPLPFLVRVFRLSVPPVKLFDLTMAEKINFNATIGPEEVGVIVGAWMFGIFTIQVILFAVQPSRH